MTSRSIDSLQRVNQEILENCSKMVRNRCSFAETARVVQTFHQRATPVYIGKTEKEPKSPNVV